MAILLNNEQNEQINITAVPNQFATLKHIIEGCRGKRRWDSGDLECQKFGKWTFHTSLRRKPNR
eukprot:653693-Amphidinium_carterae.1